MVKEREKSDSPIVATKLANKPGKPGAESVERRGGAKGNTDWSHMRRTQSRVSVSQRLDRVRQAARQRKKEKLTALFHLIDIELLETAFFWLKRRAAAGVDGVTWHDYERDLERNLKDLHGRLHRQAYRALPSRRRYIPKADGKLRPLGIAALEDKIVQRALVAVLNAVYETEFFGFSYGFRPRGSQHDALDALATGIARTNVSWVLDADISRFFDTVSHEWLIKFVEHRIGDQRVIRLIRKWLKAGAMEDGVIESTDEGTPQGSVISPLLANIYLHYVFDLWANQWRKRHAEGNVVIVRYADDIVVGFDKRRDAERFRRAMRIRLEQFELSVHPEKTRLIEFGRFAAQNRAKRGLGKPETFNFLGFTHISGRARDGKFMLRRTTRRDRMRAALREIKEELRRRWHQSIPEQGTWLRRVVQGYFNYHAVPTNYQAMQAFRAHVVDLWRRALRRRSQKDDTTWAKMGRLAKQWLPRARILHPWPVVRFDAKHPRQEPGARIAHAGICAGGVQ
ncbi:group II intron reverse transcriptase/maturase [Ralstonia solanacearum]|uniref:group II intron reverse transcriptase/maturase n=1 Tax=Ralstonia solanacearum TaxID=305 RepID=UPI000E67621F|nr:group II intron reverse transcriptase/maturase [Ralstonia solanacearum]MBT1540108.1 group II intron reverse transcriptase/maturase [Ralstonia solanacearum]QOK84182.1 group II intron reverse transcriptase/maturase [Ralstonia solanacearum]RIJ84660.1 group II intron reverse transcriptase/maturase [Ralstonia solanacearum]